MDLFLVFVKEPPQLFADKVLQYSCSIHVRPTVYVRTRIFRNIVIFSASKRHEFREVKSKDMMLVGFRKRDVV